MVTESKAGDLLPHRPAVPAAPSPQGPQPLRPKALQAAAMSPVPCEVPARLRRSSLRGNLLPPHIRAKDLDLQFPALGATRPRRDDRGSRHNQGKAIEGAAPRRYPEAREQWRAGPTRSPPGSRVPASRLHSPATPSSGTARRTRVSAQRSPAASASEGRPAGTADPPAPSPKQLAVNGRRGTLPTARQRRTPIGRRRRAAANGRRLPAEPREAGGRSAGLGRSGPRTRPRLTTRPRRGIGVSGPVPVLLRCTGCLHGWAGR